MTCANKEAYIGEWVDNKRHRGGAYRFVNGDIFIGQWTNDENPTLSLLIKRRTRAANCQDVNIP